MPLRLRASCASRGRAAACRAAWQGAVVVGVAPEEVVAEVLETEVAGLCAAGRGGCGAAACRAAWQGAVVVGVAPGAPAWQCAAGASFSWRAVPFFVVAQKEFVGFYSSAAAAASPAPWRAVPFFVVAQKEFVGFNSSAAAAASPAQMRISRQQSRRAHLEAAACPSGLPAGLRLASRPRQQRCGPSTPCRARTASRRRSAPRLSLDRAACRQA